jgi:hypothetical protein
VSSLDTGLRLALQNFKTYDFDFDKFSRTFGFGMITRSSYMYMHTFLEIKFFIGMKFYYNLN